MLPKIISFLILLLLSSITLVFAQIDPTPPPSNFVPIDGGVGFLLAAGAAYGVKKIKDFRRKE